MIPKKILNYFEIAARTATSKVDKRTFLLGAIGIRGDDGVMVKSLNGRTEMPLPCRDSHAEKRLAAKLTPGSVVYVVRVRILDGKFGMARPCFVCRKALVSRGVRRVYYTINHNEYGVIDLGSNVERITS